MTHDTANHEPLSADRLTLYQSPWCGYCSRVTYAAEQLGIDLPVRDVRADPGAREELIAGGGRSQVPCLRIQRHGTVEWLYESLDIIDFLHRHVAAE